jgi:hypothetical protein
MPDDSASDWENTRIGSSTQEEKRSVTKVSQIFGQVDDCSQAASRQGMLLIPGMRG